MSELKKIDGLEYPSGLEEISGKILSPILNNTPPIITKKVMSYIGLSELKKFNENNFAGSYKSIQEIYADKNNLSLGERIYFNSKPAKAIRNRLKLLKPILKDMLVNEYNGKKVNILDLGAGNERLCLEVLSDLKRDGFDYDNVSIIAVDGNEDAAYDGKDIADNHNLEDRIVFITDKINFNNPVDLQKFYEKATKKFGQPIENHNLSISVGLAEYLEEGESDCTQKINLYTSLYNNQENGAIITSYPKEHNLVKVCERVLNWKVNYRDEKEICDILSNVGYNNIETIPEPMKLQYIFTGWKK